MNRNTWAFPHRADELAAAAEKKIDHHKSRLTWWEAKLETTKNTIRDSGLQFDGSMADMVSNSYNRHTHVSVDEKLLRDLNEAQGKVREHRETVQGFEAWRTVLLAHGQSTFNLHHDDWLFFFSKA